MQKFTHALLQTHNVPAKNITLSIALTVRRDKRCHHSVLLFVLSADHNPSFSTTEFLLACVYRTEVIGAE